MAALQRFQTSGLCAYNQLFLSKVIQRWFKAVALKADSHVYPVVTSGEDLTLAPITH